MSAAADERRREEEALAEHAEQRLDVARARHAAEEHEATVFPASVRRLAAVAQERLPGSAARRA
jgi:hypothetical protein